MDDVGKRRVGRPKATPPSGPLVLEGGERRVKIELEIGQGTADELKEYTRWVELSSPNDAKSALFKTADFAFRDVFRRDRLWQEERKHGERRESPTAPQVLPTLPLATPSLPPPLRRRRLRRRRPRSASDDDAGRGGIP